MRRTPKAIALGAYLLVLEIDTPLHGLVGGLLEGQHRKPAIPGGLQIPGWRPLRAMTILNGSPATTLAFPVRIRPSHLTSARSRWPCMMCLLRIHQTEGQFIVGLDIGECETAGIMHALSFRGSSGGHQTTTIHLLVMKRPAAGGPSRLDLA